ncbi:hypothetical protein EDB19DRAFT_1646869 [Suillus lakei]|nr:hypothetical protein EDB19DRAFT_1646869 [Suillus lakei]
MDVEDSSPGPHNDARDLVQSIDGMYRVLDLINEQGSGGLVLVDKVIIAQDSLRAFINSVCPGTYVSMTKVNFSALDRFIVKPVGVYGSKSEIVRLLSSLGVVNEEIAKQLITNQSDSSVSMPSLRSGLYIVRAACEATPDQQLFLIYWPEDSTWDDSAPSSVKRNRVTFMRYLMKMCDQVTAFISPEHARSIVWNDQEAEDAIMDLDEDHDESSRLFTFEVAKTNEQEEAVKSRPGFKATSKHITMPHPYQDGTVDAEPPKPELLHGETTQGFMTVAFQPGRLNAEPMKNQSLTNIQLRNYLKSDALLINEGLDANALDLLISNGIRDRFQQECEQFRQRSTAISSNTKSSKESEERRIREDLEKGEPLLTRIFHEALVDDITGKFPCVLTSHTLLASDRALVPSLANLSHVLRNTSRTALRLQVQFRRRLPPEKISSRNFKDGKERICIARTVLRNCPDMTKETRESFINIVLHEDMRHVRETLRLISKGNLPHEKPKGLLNAVWDKFSSLVMPDLDTGTSSKMLKEADTDSISDVQFLVELENIKPSHIMAQIVAETKTAALEHFKHPFTKHARALAHFALRTQTDQCLLQAHREAASREEEQLTELRREFIHEINDLSRRTRKNYYYQRKSTYPSSIPTLTKRFMTVQIYISGRREYFQESVFEFSVHLMQLMEHDQHSLKMDPTMIPSPKFTGRQAYSFKLPLGHSVARAQLLSGDKILLATADRTGNLMVFLENLTAIEGALTQGRGKKLNREKIGEFILAFDESKRLLSVIAREKLVLHIFVHDTTRGFQASGSAISLTQWYGEGVSIIHACFICGSEELLLVDSLAQARIYSLTTMQFRPATLDLIQIPKAVYSTPDGSCLIATHVCGSVLTLTAYHWSTFGSTAGVPLEIPDLPLDQPLLLTSLIKRNIVHLVTLDIVSNSCLSFALDITRKVTEFTFKEKGIRGGGAQSKNATAHNCLVDCHADVWTRFPVLSAVQRETITSSSNRCPRTLVFITDQDHHMFSPHFHDLICNFERTSKKPTGTILKSMVISATTYSGFFNSLLGAAEWSVSKFRAGEWLVDILCLIPIHIAVTRENRFIPLKDGVYSPELEKSLLGADVNRIVDHLSFGWYESLFQSYMAKKPVKVVSSMGEQSVGKSFSLNHLVDTSFAGSAMRTTEGVWMSATPTKDALVVALDFEGTIERSAQEDTLLVLFNTAISNLVLFRNNFALSRDITGLFQSFQSSSTVLDPASNPSLFQSTLVIIIKDVVDSDKAEITREFALKFQQIVQDEQEANFISRLHAGQLNIIPWPVIESQEFYKLFPTLKRRLDKQKLTHNTAGEFLHVMKTLMAKLKANDWGALSQSMASHRAQLLLAMLPNALAFGLQEVNPDLELLKNLDDDVPIGIPDTSSEFSLAGGPQSSSREDALQVLSHAWGDYDTRHRLPDNLWIENLIAHLDSLVDLRVAHVREWISSNVARFQSGQASIDELMRTFESATVDLKSNLQLCKLKCGSCELLCVQSRLHDGQHDCRTSHACIHSCDFCASSGETKACTMSAGHPGNHICVVNAHLCGQACKLSGRQGCLDECTKVIGHAEDDHLCAATVHACGQPCDLSKLRLGDGSTPPCRGTCGIPSDVDHDHHRCDARLCSFPCQLCKRLCANTDHLHGLGDGAIHLCGFEHSCSMQCTAEGICEIETAPQSIEATFTGRHETFQYTKVRAVLAKRLRCTKSIPPGLVAHKGPHNHSSDPRVVHFCRAKCDHCGYYCTLPLGHPQQEHETRHGSMSSSRWAVDGPDDTGLEVEGRRFSSNDEGAPMMCNLVCQAVGRHIHIDYCRAPDAAACSGNNEVQHISKRLLPNPERAKDCMTHNLFWRRAGFKDPYSREEQANFVKCDSMCGGPEHTAAAGNAAQPSYCTLPLFHPPMDPNAAQVGLGYVSNDGHLFSCRNPVIMQQAFHLLLLIISRSGSMTSGDRRPLPNTPASDRITQRSNNRLGAVLSSLYSFWSARATAVGGQQAARRDSYSVILFQSSTTNAIVNDFSSSPDQLLDAMLPHSAYGGTNFTAAVQQARSVMEQNWSTERSPVIIFLSDGECSIADQPVQDLCRSAVRLGKGLSFHAVSFGPDRSSSSLRRMTQIALDIQNNAPRDPLAPPAATVASSYTQALDTVQLAETFLGIAESLRKPRGSLIH